MNIYYSDDLVTLYHGDCLEITAWTQADVLVTDPPYGMAYVSAWTTRRPVAGDKDPVARDSALELWGQRPALVFGTWRVNRPTDTKQVITWHKTSIGPGMGDLSLPWGNATEEIYVLGKGWQGKRRSNVISTSDWRAGALGAASQVGHPTPKPVGLLEQLIECAPEGMIADPFAGGGVHAPGRSQPGAQGDRRRARGALLRDHRQSTQPRRAPVSATEHDPFCYVRLDLLLQVIFANDCRVCDLLRQVRADERRKTLEEISA